MIKTTVDSYGKLNILYNNAGVNKKEREEKWGVRLLLRFSSKGNKSPFLTLWELVTFTNI